MGQPSDARQDFRTRSLTAANRRTEAVVEQNGQRLHVMKGAVRTVVEACGPQPPAIESLEAWGAVVRYDVDDVEQDLWKLQPRCIFSCCNSKGVAKRCTELWLAIPNNHVGAII
jgi:hypothetical protein